MSDATKLILEQWGAFGAVLVVLGFVIWRLWTDSTSVMKTTITTLTADNKALTVALAECNAAWRADKAVMAGQMIDMTKDTVEGLANASNAIEASTAVSNDIKVVTMGMAEELRRRRGG